MDTFLRPYPLVEAHFPSHYFIVGGGVAIFHLATERVVICSAILDGRGTKYYFLPKGRRDAGEESGRGAEREGYEESGYRNRLLPLPIRHQQPQAHPRVHAKPVTAEPVWVEMMSHIDKQYIVYWYIAETLPPDLEKELETEKGAAYKSPPQFPRDLTLRDRIQQEPEGYEPLHHEGTGVDKLERTYQSYLVPVQEAMEKLGRSTVMAQVVHRGWCGIKGRLMKECSDVNESWEDVSYESDSLNVDAKEPSLSM